jgi:hypothetical protein
LDVESVANATRIGWLVIAVLACAFSYSIGFQFGYSNGTASADDRYSRVNDSLRSIITANEEANAAAHAHASARTSTASTF